jgi:dipeptidyl aminopeptidase/acylaminoacyl peptidase
VVPGRPAGRIRFRAEGAGSRDLHVKDASNGKEEILLESAERKVPNDWSSDGRFLAYNQVSAGESGGIDIWILPLSGVRKPFPFLVSPYYKSNARFSPDGRWLAYASDESGRFEIYVEPFPEHGDKIRISTSGGTQPLWRKDGKELFYLAPDGSLTAIAIKGTSALEPGIPTPLFRAPLIVNPVLPQYAVADNGQRFLFLVPVGASPPAPITVVLNWSRVLKQ